MHTHTYTRTHSFIGPKQNYRQDKPCLLNSLFGEMEKRGKIEGGFPNLGAFPCVVFHGSNFSANTETCWEFSANIPRREQVVGRLVESHDYSQPGENQKEVVMQREGRGNETVFFQIRVTPLHRRTKSYSADSEDKSESPDLKFIGESNSTEHEKNLLNSMLNQQRHQLHTEEACHFFQVSFGLWESWWRRTFHNTGTAHTNSWPFPPTSIQCNFTIAIKHSLCDSSLGAKPTLANWKPNYR